MLGIERRAIQEKTGLSPLGDFGSALGAWGGRVGGAAAGEALFPVGGAVPGALIGGRIGSLGGRAAAEWLNGLIFAAGSENQNITTGINTSSPNNETCSASDGDEKTYPPLPDKIVGAQDDPRAGPNKNGRRHTSGPLTPENGGTGDFEADLNTLTGGYSPSQPEDRFPPGSLVGPNGIFGRPVNSSGGKSIDIPANGDKPHETLHYR